MTSATAEESSSERPSGFMPQLDSLRALAVFAVMLHHFNVWDVDLGFAAHAGVRLFLVLSGFLITGILLRARDLVAGGRVGLRQAFGDFYARRALRILPIYYLVVVGLIVADAPDARALAPWLLSYLTNFGIMELGYYPATFAHLWTLAVEQQFYLIWPLVVLFAPPRLLMAVTIACLAVGPLFRLAGALLQWDGITTYIATPGCLDSLSAGALLALLRRRTPDAPLARGVARIATYGGAAASVALHLVPPSVSEVKLVLLGLALSVASAGLVWRAADGFGGRVAQVLETPAILYLGKISYGLYVYHLLVRDVLVTLAQGGPNKQLLEGWVGPILFLAVTVAVSALSWRLIEQPLLRLKGRFVYARVAPT